MPQVNLGYTGLSVKKPDSKDCTLCCFSYMTFWKVQIYRGQKLVDFQSLVISCGDYEGLGKIKL